ncbi:MAG: 50S ribosomal protein L11 methyltransferase [Pseudomonadota bacterium]|nr:50S ribosomal protein L11 methyltransferase [Pseudomonadota bacterium]MDP1905719.1 50S ribosomal protein L11 methyltransferase [Pseudomonadota bacterium]MDP2353591.1 50S ribosomal protein L11 methyltransferase [Pseudomonadota bacterium]
MPWLSLKLAANQDEAEGLADALMDAGALSVSIEDRDAGTEAELPQFGEPGLDDPKAWERNWVVALLDADADLPTLFARLGLPADHEHQIERVEEQDWVRLTQSQFAPIPISKRLWIVPSWHDAPDPEAITLVLDPGLAFGTGSHPTTRLCLQWLEASLHGTESVLDYGCGSGILAIAAVKLGAGRVIGVDVDAQAVTASRDNAERNRVSAEFSLPDAAPAGQFEVLVANILTNPLKALMPLLAARVTPGGRIALSGILAEQAEEVMAIYGQAFTMRLWKTEEGWVCLEGRRLASDT